MNDYNFSADQLRADVEYLAKLMGIDKDLYIKVLCTLCEKYYVMGQSDGIKEIVNLRKGLV